MTASPVKELALAWNLPVLQPQRLKDPDLVQRLAALAPELMVVVAYGRILTPEILALPSVGVLNVHASLLPRYRGAAPINWALIRGEQETGVTIQWMAVRSGFGADFSPGAGAHRGGRQCRRPFTTSWRSGARPCWCRPWKCCAGVKPSREPKTSAAVTLAPPITREMRRLNWELPAPEAAGWIRGLDPRPGAYALWQGKVLEVIRGPGEEKSRGTWRPRARCSA